MMHESDFKMSVPATGIIDFHVKKSWEFNVYSGWQMCLGKVLIYVITVSGYWHRGPYIRNTVAAIFIQLCRVRQLLH